MKIAIRIASFLALGLTIVPAFMVFAGSLAWDTHANIMLAGTVLWFFTAPFWMKGRE